MKTRNLILHSTFPKSFPLLAALSFGCVAGAIVHAAPREHAVPEVRQASIESDAFGPVAFGMQVDIPVGQMAWTQVSRDLNSWTDFGPPVLAVRDEMELFVPVDDADSRLFFRVVTEPLPLELATNREGLVLTIAREIDARSLLAFLQQQTGERLYVPINEPLIANERVEPIRAGTYTGEDLERLLANLELAVWTPATEEDHPSLADRFPAEPREQAGPLLDDEPGRGEIEDGWRNNEVAVVPERGPDEPEPDRDPEMALILDPPDLPPGRAPEADRDLPDPGFHLRVGIELHQDGTFEPRFAIDLPGHAALPEPFPVPGDGGMVIIVRSSLGATGQPSEILQIGVAPNPLIVHSYDDSFDGPHDTTFARSGLLRIPVALPLLERREVDDLLDGISLEVLELIDGGDMRYLTPETFERNRDRFRPRAILNETDIRDLLAATRREREETLHPTSSHPSLTFLHYSGPPSQKYNLVIIGDGFDSSSADQQTFQDYVNDVILNDFLGRDIHPEILNAINIYRIDAISEDSGVTQVDENGNVTDQKLTVLRYRYSGVWDRCWMEFTPGPFGTEFQLESILSALVPQADAVAVILNESNGGGCRRGNQFAVTLGSSADTFSHEFGHLFGNLGDEYSCTATSSCGGHYKGDKPSAVNLDNEPFASPKWAQWYPSWRPFLNFEPHIADPTQDVGRFLGATIGTTRYNNGLYRPTFTGRMRSGSQLHNPIGYTQFRAVAYPRQDRDFSKTVVGDFDGDGLHDLVMLDDRQLGLFLARPRDRGPDDPILGEPPRPPGGVLEPTWFNTGQLWNTAGNWVWIPRKNDRMYAGDFNGNGRDDLVVFNGQNWGNNRYLAILRSNGDSFEPVSIYQNTLPGWTMRPNDQHFLLDFDGDGRKDLIIYNGTDWSIPYLILLRSTGTGLQYVRRYDRYLPNWEMGNNEQIFVGNFNGNNREEFAIFDGHSWNQGHFRIYTSTGTGLQLRDRHYGEIPFLPGLPWWVFRPNDRIYALDFDGDGTTDLAFFNGVDWAPVYLGMRRVVDGEFAQGVRYNNVNFPVPGWQMQRHDRHWIADVNGNGRDDLVVFNSTNWNTPYLGMMRSVGDPGHLQATWQATAIGGWPLGTADSFHVADFRGDLGWDDLFVYRPGRFGLLRSHSNHYKLEAIYPLWIHNHRWHNAGWW